MSWLIDAKIREIQKEIDGHKRIRSELREEYKGLYWWQFQKRKEVSEEYIREAGVIYGLEDAREILKDKSIR